MKARARAIAFLGGVVLLATVFATLPGRAASVAPAPESSPPVIAAVGDIACNTLPREHSRRCKYDKVADLVAEGGYHRFLALGDLQYLHGSLETFLAYYDRFFDRVKGITAPVPGNHETYTLHMQGYMDYFGELAHPPRGYYSFDLGEWHLIALNSQLCKGDGTTWHPELGQGTPVLRNEEAGGCRPGDAQYEWLKRDLVRNPNAEFACTLAYLHHPLYKWSDYPLTGPHWTRPLWRLLFKAGADVVLAGHDHNYQRFAPQDPQGNLDPAGLTLFIVGTGGDTYQSLPEDKPAPDTYVTGQGTSFGVLRMTLHPTSYDFEFMTAAGERPFEDAGSVECR